MKSDTTPMAKAIQFKRLPRQIVKTKAEIIMLIDIIGAEEISDGISKDLFMPEEYENASSKYRKSPYQHESARALIWKQELIKSILIGASDRWHNSLQME